MKEKLIEKLEDLKREREFNLFNQRIFEVQRLDKAIKDIERLIEMCDEW